MSVDKRCANTLSRGVEGKDGMTVDENGLFFSPTFLSRLHYVWLEFSNFKPLFSVVKSIRTKRIFYAATVFDRNALKVVNSIAYTFRRIFLNSYFECIDKNSGGSRPQNRMKAVQNTDRYFFRVPKVVGNSNVAICRVVLRVVLLKWKIWTSAKRVRA